MPTGYTPLLLAVVLFQHARAQNNSSTDSTLASTPLDDNTRTLWDILWTCLATTFACTWTVLHVDVPNRDVANSVILLRKFKMLVVAVLAPELLAWNAVEDISLARTTTALCNEAEKRIHDKEEGLKSRLLRRAMPLEGGLVFAEDDLSPEQEKWTLAHGFCINMRGVALKTQDGWLYMVRRGNVETLIAAGILNCTDIRDREIADRTKADSFAKAFSVLQSTWVMGNIIARSIYRLPVTPLEVATVAYVVCAIFIYAMLWHKPKDMMTPIVVSLPYPRGSEDVPQEVWSTMNSKPRDWVHSRVIPHKLKTSHIFIRTQFTEPNGYTNNTRGGQSGPRANFLREFALDHFIFFISETYCCIHLAAWNYSFPTEAEKSAWRILSLIMIGLPFVLFAILQGPAYMRLLSSLVKIPGIQNYINPESKWTKKESFTLNATFFLYLAGRIGVVVLTLLPLRALPAESYIGINWLAAIPHI